MSQLPAPPQLADVRLYVVAYDIREPKRWRRVFKTMHGYGEWLQLSVFQCRLSRRRQIEMVAALSELIHHKEDHVIVLDLGAADRVELRVTSLGKTYEPVVREPIIV
jgi:CRISPR-associated protein Cas2